MKAHHEAALQGRGTILVVDDDPNFMELMCDLLRREDFNVITATDPQEALEMMKGHPAELAIIDIRLHEPNNPNDRSGLNLSTSVGKIIPVIFITGHPTKEQDPQHERAFNGVDKGSRTWETDLLEQVQRSIRPVVYISHADSPREAEVSSYIKSLGLICSEWRPADADGIGRAFTTEAKRVAFAVVLLTADEAVPPSPITVQAKERVAFEWGYFSNKLPKRTLVLHEEGVHLPSHADLENCVRFDRRGSWMMALNQKLRTEGIYVVSRV
jgi:CheY-like chemotaxis protein